MGPHLTMHPAAPSDLGSVGTVKSGSPTGSEVVYCKMEMSGTQSRRKLHEWGAQTPLSPIMMASVPIPSSHLLLKECDQLEEKVQAWFTMGQLDKDCGGSEILPRLPCKRTGYPATVVCNQKTKVQRQSTTLRTMVVARVSALFFFFLASVP